MLTLSLYNTKYAGCIDTAAQYVDHLRLSGGTSRDFHTAISASSFEDTAAPFILNGYKLHWRYSIIPAILDINIEEQKNYFDSCIDGFVSSYDRFKNETYTENSIAIITVYTDSVELTASTLKEKLAQLNLKVPGNGVTELFNKAATQAVARDNIYMDDKVIVLTSRTSKEVFVITDCSDPNNKSLHLAALGLIPVMYPDIKENLTELELDLFKAYTARTQLKRISNVDCNKAWQDIFFSDSTAAKAVRIKYDSKLREVRKQLVIKEVKENIKNVLDANIVRSKQAAERLLDEYRRTLQTIKDQELRKAGCRLDDTELEIDTLFNTEGIADIKCNAAAETIRLYIVTYLEYYNTDEAEIVYNNLEEGTPDSVATLFKRFFKDVFIDQTYKLRVFALFKYHFGIDAPYSDPDRNDGYVNYDAIFNPHIQYFSCLGDYKPNLIKAHTEKDLLMYANLAIASTKSINFADSIVFHRFKDHILDSYRNNSTLVNIPALIDKDGVEYSINTLFKNYLKEIQPEETETETETE